MIEVIENDRSYLRFLKHLKSGRVTYNVIVMNKVKGTKLGEIKWHPPFRKYTFVAEPNSFLDSKTLLEISNMCNNLQDKRNRRKDMEHFSEED